MLNNSKTTVAPDKQLISKSWFIKVAADDSCINFFGLVTVFDMSKIGGIRQLADMALSPNAYMIEADTARIEELKREIEEFALSTQVHKNPVYSSKVGDWIYYVNPYMAEKEAFYIQEFDNGSVQYDKRMLVSKSLLDRAGSLFSGIEIVPPRPE